MAAPTISPAYQQVVEWYHRWQAAENAKPIALLVTAGAPDEAADAPKQTSPQTQLLDVFV